MLKASRRVIAWCFKDFYDTMVLIAFIVIFAAIGRMWLQSMGVWQFWKEPAGDDMVVWGLGVIFAMAFIYLSELVNIRERYDSATMWDIVQGSVGIITCFGMLSPLFAVGSIVLFNFDLQTLTLNLVEKWIAVTAVTILWLGSNLAVVWWKHDHNLLMKQGMGPKYEKQKQ